MEDTEALHFSRLTPGRTVVGVRDENDRVAVAMLLDCAPRGRYLARSAAGPADPAPAHRLLACRMGAGPDRLWPHQRLDSAGDARPPLIQPAQATIKGATMRNQRGFTVTELFAIVPILLVVIGIGGWVANIVKVFGSDFDHFTFLLGARLVGIVLAPLGSVLGFI